jgi:chemotaxis response regulator CheB
VVKVRELCPRPGVAIEGAQCPAGVQVMRKKQIGSRKSPSGRSRGGTAHKAKSAKPGSQTASLIVGIGASAGGLGAFKAFFSNMPPDSGMTFVLVQHLAPDHKSLLADLIGKVTAMPVIDAENETAVAPNTVYVIPPDATLYLQAAQPSGVQAGSAARTAPTDRYFLILAGRKSRERTQSASFFPARAPTGRSD